MRTNLNGRRLLIISNTSQFIVSHRLPVIKAAVGEMIECYVAAAPDPQAEAQIAASGARFRHIHMSRINGGLIAELKTFLAILTLIRELRPDILHLVTIKPVVYGGIAARITRTHGVLYAITGLRFRRNLPASSWFIRTAINAMLKLALRAQNSICVVQNDYDLGYISASTGVPEKRLSLIRGSGTTVTPIPPRNSRDIPIVIMAARLVRAKGVCVYFRAAEILVERGVRARFLLAGALDSSMPDALPPHELASFHRTGGEWLGYVRDFENLLRHSDIACLPTLGGEGVPKFLIDAAAAALPIVATEVPGVTDVVIDHMTGLLVPTGNAPALADALQLLILSPEKRNELGVSARQMAERRFNIKSVVDRHIDLYAHLVTNRDHEASQRILAYR